MQAGPAGQPPSLACGPAGVQACLQSMLCLVVSMLASDPRRTQDGQTLSCGVGIELIDIPPS